MRRKNSADTLSNCQHEMESQITDAKLGMHNGADSLLASMEFVKKPELAILEKPFKLTYTNGKVWQFQYMTDNGNHKPLLIEFGC